MGHTCSNGRNTTTFFFFFCNFKCKVHVWEAAPTANLQICNYGSRSSVPSLSTPVLKASLELNLFSTMFIFTRVNVSSLLQMGGDHGGRGYDFLGKAYWGNNPRQYQAEVHSRTHLRMYLVWSSPRPNHQLSPKLQHYSIKNLLCASLIDK